MKNSARRDVLELLRMLSHDLRVIESLYRQHSTWHPLVGRRTGFEFPGAVGPYPHAQKFKAAIEIILLAGCRQHKEGWEGVHSTGETKG